MQILRLIYNNAGNSILALTSNASHLYWKWSQNDTHSSNKLQKVPPLPWQPSSSSGLMSNDLTGSSPEETVPCFAVSKNDSCLLSASGGRISLYSLLEFKWSPGDFGAPISHATFSCDGQMVHASFEDGVVSIFDASAQMYCLVFSSTQTTMADHCPMLLSYHNPPPLLAMTFSDGARNGKQGKGN